MRYTFYTKLILSVILMSLVSSCGSGSEEDIDVPTGVLNEETFTKVLVDFSLAESASNLNVKNVSGEKMDSTYAFDPLKENKISKAEYDSAISFYSKHPALYKKVYENVLTTLSKLQIKKDTTVKVDQALK